MDQNEALPSDIATSNAATASGSMRTPPSQSDGFSTIMLMTHIVAYKAAPAWSQAIGTVQRFALTTPTQIKIGNKTRSVTSPIANANKLSLDCVSMNLPLNELLATRPTHQATTLRHCKIK